MNKNKRYMAKGMKKCSHIRDDISLFLVPPLETGIRGFTGLVNYYEYKAPLIDSVHSSGMEYSVDSQDKVLKKMLSEAELSFRTKFIQRIQKNSLETMDLDGDLLCFKCSRILCSIYKDESELKALLRHLRNGFAHGRTYIKKTKNQTFIMIEDYDNKKNKITARIVVTKAILLRWRKNLIGMEQT